MFPLTMNGVVTGNLEHASDLGSVKADIAAYLKDGGFETEIDDENVYFHGGLLMSGKLMHRVPGTQVGKGNYTVTFESGRCRIKYNISTIRIFIICILLTFF